jgi:hypothetical protein
MRRATFLLGLVFVVFLGVLRVPGLLSGAWVYGRAGADTLYGKGFEDRFEGEADNDTIYGQGGGTGSTATLLPPRPSRATST